MDTNDGVTPTSTPGTTVATNTWVKIDAVYNTTSGNIEMYHNGVLVSETDNSSITTLSGSTQQFNIGVYDTPSGSPSGPATSTSIALPRLSMTAPNAAQVRQMYEAEKGMFVASAKCLLQGASDAVLDVSINPHTGDVLVTQADKQTKFRGLVVLEERTIATGGTTFEHGLLFGENNDVVEINDANLYATTASKDIRGTIADVEYLKKVVAPGIDMSKAKAWCVIDNNGSFNITASYNVLSATDHAVGDFTIVWAIPFKSANYSCVGMSGAGIMTLNGSSAQTATESRLDVESHTGARTDHNFNMVVAFGELENEQ